MNKDFLKLQTDTLLKEFGAGGHKPGSGSAAALQGLLSAQLILTVIELTLDPKRASLFGAVHSKFQKAESNIVEDIYPALERLFHEDAKAFDKAIQFRVARDGELEFAKKDELAIQALQALREAIDIPIGIGKLCSSLADHAIVVFDDGFTSARGDSHVALDAAIAGIAGCLSIVQLNLKSLSTDDWTDKIRREASLLKLQYNRLLKEAASRLDKLEVQAEKGANSFAAEADSFRSGFLGEKKRDDADIERIVDRLQSSMWQHRLKIWKGEAPEEPIDILHPEIVVEEILGYKFRQVNSLGQHPISDGISEIAGMLDKNRKLVMVSTQFSNDTQNFTAAHELGHAILHKGLILHRDKPIDGSRKYQRTEQELEADKFAVYFLMPTNLVKDMFGELFSTNRFVITRDTAFALNQSSESALRDKCGNLRGLTRFLASCDFFYRPFKSISERFRVSVETMAIRLEELNLVEF